MRSRSPNRRRRDIRHKSPRKRSGSSSSSASDKNVDVKNKDKSERREERHNRLHRKAMEKEKSRNKHHYRHDRDSSKSESEQKPFVRKEDSKKYSGSAKRNAKRSRSRSLDKKRPRMEGHKRRGGHIRSKSLEKKQPKVEVQNDKSSSDRIRSSDKNQRKEGGRRNSARARSRSFDDPKMSSESITDRTKKKADKDGKHVANLKEESRISGYEGLVESDMICRRKPTQKRFDQSSVTLNERFSQFYEDKQLSFDESISIEIERNIDGDEPFVIPNFHPHEVLLPRRSEEGRKPLSSRKEFNSVKSEEQHEAHAEKRVVTVMKSFNQDSAYETTWYKIGQNAFGHGEGTVTQPNLFWKDNGRDAVIQVPVVTSQKTKESEMEVTSAADSSRQRPPRGPARQDNVERRGQRSFPQSRDFRQVSGFQERQEMGEIRSQDQNFRNFRGRGNRYEPSGRRRPFEGSYSRVATTVARGQRPSAREENRNQPDELPDFSRRPDKYTYDVWKDKPEMIPRGRSYFEHDNRGEDDQWDFNRNNGRGGFTRGGRGRGGFMRGGRGRGFQYRGMQNFQDGGFSKPSGSVESVQWKHDKFEMLLEDEKPSSTTEK